MATDAFASRLNDLEIFRGLSPLRITEIVRQAERIVFRDGQTIVTAGSAGDGAYVIIDGEAVAMDDTEPDAFTRRIAPGSLLGEMAMLTEHAYTTTIVSHGTVRALKITREALHQQMADDPLLAQHFVARISSRLTRVAVELRRLDQMLALASEGAVAHLS